jgi:lipopolysaccharide/colanic/teichoic acid biosynthesis glycosyltransferase
MTVKRLIDVVAGMVLGLLALPAIVVLAVISAITFRAWPFFVQNRVGLDGRPFRFVKLRTLPPSAPPAADKYAIAAVPTPRLMQRLRLLHLDELPQLVLVVTGRMSLVGPRPELPVLHAKLDPQVAAERVAVRPGCTGLWQISPASFGLIGEDASYDRAYLAHRSARLDAWILWRTALVLIGRGRLVDLDDVPRWALSAGPAEPALAPATADAA